MSPNTLTKGMRGERIACDFLLKSGYRIIERNWRCKWGEIDIIAAIEGTIVFIEVKSATGTGFGAPMEWVTPRKRKKIIMAAKQYILDNPIENMLIRFDVIAIDLRMNTVNHIPNAFYCEEE